MRELADRHGESLAALVRYVLAGGVVFVVYVGTTLLLSGPVGAPIQAAIPVGYALAVVVHFVLQRTFVFAGQEFALSTREQLQRYAAVGAVQYSVTATATAVLPGVLGADEQVVYVAVTVAFSFVTFLLLRGGVFHAAGADGATAA